VSAEPSAPWSVIALNLSRNRSNSLWRRDLEHARATSSLGSRSAYTASHAEGRGFRIHQPLSKGQRSQVRPLAVSGTTATRLREMLRIYPQEADNSASTTARLQHPTQPSAASRRRRTSAPGQPLSARRLALSVALEAATASDPSKRRDRLARPHDLRYGNRRAGKKVLLDGKQEPRRFQAARLSRATSRPGDKRPPRPGNQRPRGRELSSFVDRP
jgi:hypothetical protein